MLSDFTLNSDFTCRIQSSSATLPTRMTPIAPPPTDAGYAALGALPWKNVADGTLYAPVPEGYVVAVVAVEFDLVYSQLNSTSRVTSEH